MSAIVLDVSEFQPEKIDWDKIKNNGYKVIVRAGYRGSLKSNPAKYKKICYDEHFKTYLDGIIKAGVSYSAYFFPTSITDEEADQEADWIIMVFGKAVLDMPFYLDSENVYGKYGDQGRANALSKEQRTRFLKRITDKLVTAGIPCGVYASTSWLRNKIDMSQLQEQVIDNTWVAQYNTKCTYDGKYVMWQYTSKGKVDGISGDVDMSVIKGKFNMKCQKKVEKQEHSRSAIVSEAKSHIGIKEGSKAHHKIIDRYNSYKPLPLGYKVKYTDPWCATFISYLAMVMGYTDIIPVECSCPRMIELAKKMGIWQESDAYKPQKGDIVMYDWQDSGTGDNTGTADHVGIVSDVDGDNFTVIEGNFSDSVKTRKMARNGRYIRGYITPHYDDKTPVKWQETSKNTEVWQMLPEIKKGSNGKAVKWLQIALGGLTVDGDFGTKTEAALKAYQKKHGLSVDGVCASKTWKSIISTL